MKNQLNLRFFFIAFISVFLFTSLFQNLFAQEVKKNKVRLKVDYFKIMDHEAYFNIKAFSRIDKENVDVSNIELIIYNDLEDEKIKVGSTTTNMEGESKFILTSLNAIKPDSTQTYNMVVSFKGNDLFKKSSKSISFKDATIKARVITKDSLNYISATLTETSKDSALVDQTLNVQVARLFSPLRIGEEFNYTDENGTILVPIEDGIPGVDGNLIIEVVLKENDDFGTVKAIINAPLGVPIVDESTFDQRKMWSPRNKTPIFILIFANLLILAMWGIIIYLIVNLFRINKI
ncbi:hypothetical protein [Changchengzhania lutea]|uniref:hypothetical protein n=1 Tax=Changchengzhania lutea TaxID=2049305 RepID=UPI00115D44C8|nr:hypothetical protein [Changchengzhania lutea]